MPAYDKVECPDCGEMVSMHPMSQKKHKRECKMSPVENEIKEVTQVEVKKEEIVSADEATTELYKIAMQAQEKRKQSPELFVAGVHSDVRKELVARYAEDCVNPRYDPRQVGQERQFAEYHACFYPASKAAIAAHNGYIPVLDENKLHVQHEGDLLFKIPRDMWLQKELAGSNESRVRREGQTDAETEQLKASGGKGTTVESERTTEKLN